MRCSGRTFDNALTLTLLIGRRAVGGGRRAVGGGTMIMAERNATTCGSLSLDESRRGAERNCLYHYSFLMGNNAELGGF